MSALASILPPFFTIEVCRKGQNWTKVCFPVTVASYSRTSIKRKQKEEHPIFGDLARVQAWQFEILPI